MDSLQEVARVPIATLAGEFDVRAFEARSGFVYLALVKGEISDGQSVLARVHSECLTGDALGSLRCDCGLQLRIALRRISAEGAGVLVYATGHEGRGIGLTNKLLAYMLQDQGHDTVSANQKLHLPVDGRDYTESILVLKRLGVQRVRLMTNNPTKARALEAGGIAVDEILPLQTSPQLRNVSYLRTKRDALGHLSPAGDAISSSLLGDASTNGSGKTIDVTELLGEVHLPRNRPFVVVKYAQTLDGRIATASGDSKWISGDDERRIAHALRAACDAVLVGIRTVEKDDPQLTVRMVPGASPIRIVLDSKLRIPVTAKVLDDDAPTVVFTSSSSAGRDRVALSQRGVAVRVVPKSLAGIDLRVALVELRGMGVRTVLVEGGSKVITSLFADRLVDRAIIGIAPIVLGAGTAAIGELGIDRISESLVLENRTTHVAGRDLLIAGDVVWPHALDDSALTTG